jgi:hypothetical protein
MTFWDKASVCKHENTYDCYTGYVYCSTPYCEAHEYHCKDCGVYITGCLCGASNGMSGWPYKKVRAHERRRANKKRQ